MTSQPMTLGQLLDESGADWADIAVTGITSDSRRVRSGDLFVALRGERADGADFLSMVAEADARAALIDDAAKVDYDGPLPLIRVKDLAKQLSAIAARFYADPSASLDVIAITGTNGKTTTAFFVAQLLQALGRRAGVVGTLGYGLVGGDITATGLTTPDAIATQKAVAELKQHDADTLAVEVSSHALVQHRARYVAIDTAVFTNLTHDHLDYHGDLKAYGKAKAKLLKARGLKQVVINRDDEWCKALGKKARNLAHLDRVVSYSLSSPKADIYCESIDYDAEGFTAQVNISGELVAVRSQLMGDFNVSNLLAAIAVAYLRGFTPAQIATCAVNLVSAPGRMEQIYGEYDRDVQVLVDYAHTPDALVQSLRALRRHTEGSIWCVFGCGGDRDADKRPIMGRAAEKSADYVLVTNDNPRGEDPAVIIQQIMRGMHNPERCLVIPEREKAIELAVQQAASGDAVLIAGKGHEQTQIFAGREQPFSDIKQAQLALNARLRKGGAA